MSSRAVRVLGMTNEVYYTPQIVALRLGFFEDEGLRVAYEVVPIADLPAQLGSGQADIVLCGLWQPWLYVERVGQPLVVFAALNQQVPLLLFGRVPPEQFDWSALDGGVLLHTSVGAPSPWCALQELLRRKKVDLGAVRLLPGFPPAEARMLFEGGYGDVLELFGGLGGAPSLADPAIHLLVPTWERELGTIPWSVFFTSRDRLQGMRAQVVGFTRALARAQRWIREHSADEVADVVAPWFGHADGAHVRLLCKFFVAQEQWPASPAPERDSIERWASLLVRAGLLSKAPSYTETIDEEIAAEATAG